MTTDALIESLKKEGCNNAKRIVQNMSAFDMRQTEVRLKEGKTVREISKEFELDFMSVNSYVTFLKKIEREKIEREKIEIENAISTQQPSQKPEKKADTIRKIKPKVAKPKVTKPKVQKSTTKEKPKQSAKETSKKPSKDATIKKQPKASNDRLRVKSPVIEVKFTENKNSVLMPSALKFEYERLKLKWSDLADKYVKAFEKKHGYFFNGWKAGRIGSIGYFGNRCAFSFEEIVFDINSKQKVGLIFEWYFAKRRGEKVGSYEDYLHSLKSKKIK